MQSQLNLFTQSFENEAALRGAICDLLARMPGISGVQLTHGYLEHGKDIVFNSVGALGEESLCACVVKNTKISGAVDSDSGAMAVLYQAKQALNNPFLDSGGEQKRISRVYVMSPREISQVALLSIQGELQERSGQVKFFCGNDLLALFEEHYSEYLLLKSGLLTSYVSTLRQAFEDSGPLHHLTLKHGMLGSAKRNTAKAYVKPSFQLCFRAINSQSLSIPHLGRLHESITANQLEDVQLSIHGLLDFLNICADDACRTFKSVAQLRTINDDLRQGLKELEEDWQNSYKANLARKQKQQSTYERQLVSLTLERGRATQSRLQYALKSIQRIIDEISSLGSEAALRCAKGACGVAALNESYYCAYNLCSELSRATTNFLRVGEVAKTYTFTESLLDEFTGSLLISGPPGYGKTSFCKWSALFDGERFASGDANVLPVYVALHRFTETEPGSFEASFLEQDKIPDLMKVGKSNLAGNRVRLYLDGLDEVPQERQRELIRIAKQGSYSYPDMQIVVTARDHVAGPWLSWLPRVQISELTAEKARDLVSQLLDGDEMRIAKFFEQLELVPALKQLVSIPLLCTLTVSVFSGAMSLPESKSELYRIFVDLLCGGWDLAKGVKRASQFNSASKLRVVVHLASKLHFRKARTIDSENLREALKTGGFVHLGSWEALINDIVQDGLLTRDGSSFAFSHLSFQEYLCARFIADANNESDVRAKILEAFLSGDDWWREVATFYIGLSNRPDRLLQMIGSLAESKTADLQRVQFLRSTIRETFPTIKQDSRSAF